MRYIVLQCIHGYTYRGYSDHTYLIDSRASSAILGGKSVRMASGKYDGKYDAGKKIFRVL